MRERLSRSRKLFFNEIRTRTCCSGRTALLSHNISISPKLPHTDMQSVVPFSDTRIKFHSIPPPAQFEARTPGIFLFVHQLRFLTPAEPQRDICTSDYARANKTLLHIILHSDSWFTNSTTTGHTYDFISNRVTLTIRIVFIVSYTTYR